MSSFAAAFLAVALALSAGAAPLLAQQIDTLAVGFVPVAVSADGLIVAGAKEADGEQYAARWTEEVGVQQLHTEPSSVLGMSRDGTVIVGATSPQESAWQWSESGGLVTLPKPELTNPDVEIYAYSALAVAVVNGSTIVYGLAYPEAASDQIRVVRWVDGGGADVLPHGDGEDMHILDLSADGSVLVGWHREEEGGFRSVKWVDGQPQTLADGFDERASVSDNGKVVFAQTADGLIRWNDEGRQILHPHSGRIGGSSADGSAAVGRSLVDDPAPARQGAYLWTEEDSLRLIQDVLEDLGVDVSGFTFYRADDISADGSTVIGQDIDFANRRTIGWRAVLCGQVVTWSSDSGGSFGDADNWSTTTVPGVANVAGFTSQGTYSVSLNDSTENASLIVSDGADLTLSTGSHTYVLSAECAAASIIVDSGFLDVEDGAVEAADMVLLTGTSTVRRN